MGLCHRRRPLIMSLGLSGILLLLVYISRHPMQHIELQNSDADREPRDGIGKGGTYGEVKLDALLNLEKLSLNKVKDENFIKSSEKEAPLVNKSSEPTVEVVSQLSNDQIEQKIEEEDSPHYELNIVDGTRNLLKENLIDMYAGDRVRELNRKNTKNYSVYNVANKQDIKNSILKKIQSLGKNRPPAFRSVFDRLVNMTKLIIRKSYENGPYDVDFTPGQKVPLSKIKRVLILSSWRSGSTFLGDLLRSYPGTFYSFEPLHIYLKAQHLESGPDVEKVLTLLKDVSLCNFSAHQDYVNYMRNNSYLMQYNKQPYSVCSRNELFCYDSSYLSEVCQYYPLNVMKTVRLGMKPIERLFEDETLDFKVIQLVRDPRGTMHSRKKLFWCKSKACGDPKTVCDDLKMDLEISEIYTKKYPGRYVLVRYEDLSTNSEAMAKQLFKFLGLTYTDDVKRFLALHTKSQPTSPTVTRGSKAKKPKTQSPYSTYRDSKAIAFSWRDSSPYDIVKNIQDFCREPLQMLGFNVFDNERDFRNASIPVSFV